jgi:branched-chain amino acid transport system substrate-binding protein
MRRRRVATAGAVLAAVGVFVAFAGSSTGSAASGTVTIGASLSLSGDFATDGQGFQRGYELWAKDQNAKGGLLGKTIKLDIVSDASQPSQVTTNYNKLIGSDHDAFVLGPFSTLLTVPASKVVARRLRVRRGRRRRPLGVRQRPDQRL